MIGVMGIRCLSIHAEYRCRHTGSCCSHVWVIPAESRLVQLIHSGDIDPPKRDAPLFVSTPHPAVTGTTLVLARYDGACVFFERDAGRLCTIHRQRGVDALPSACRHFPRVHLRDGRGTFVSLSHFCPTAARMLLDEAPISIVEARPPLALEGAIEGFDATDTLPPLLRPEMLTDAAGYGAWEIEAIRTLGRPDLTHGQALSTIAAATAVVREWVPAMGPLDAFVARTFASTIALPDAHIDPPGDAARLAAAEAACPRDGGRVVERAADSVAGFEDIWNRLVTPGWASFDGAVKRYLAARLFANWMAYRGSGLRSVVEWLKICLALLRNETARQCALAERALDADLFVAAVRECDRVAIHVLDTRLLAIELLRVESAGVG
jgi:Fe-S-cluster containining protein